MATNPGEFLQAVEKKGRPYPSRLSPGEKTLCRILAREADDQGRAYPRTDDLAAEMETSEMVVRQHGVNLMRKGWLTRTRVSRASLDGYKYQLRVPKDPPIWRMGGD